MRPTNRHDHAAADRTAAMVAATAGVWLRRFIIGSSAIVAPGSRTGEQVTAGQAAALPSRNRDLTPALEQHDGDEW
jgi:hypothetical protein